MLLCRLIPPEAGKATGAGGRAAPKVTPTQKKISLSLTITISSRINAHDYSAELK
ncbi:hypothetical protein ES703_49938 [subsurface metagenome]